MSVSPGDAPLGWRTWQKPCEDQALLFCDPYGAGNNVAPGQRVRLVLDMLDDVRRRYRVAPDQTYLAGLGGGGRAACVIAFALPEFFGGVIVSGEGAPLNELLYLRLRARDRLSVVVIAAGKDHALTPYFDETGVRCKLWTAPNLASEGPPAAVLADTYAWLAGDVDRRRAEARARPGLAAPDEAYTNLQQATLAVEAAKADLARPEHLGRGAALLEGVVARWGRTEPADAARTLLQDLRADPRKQALWEDEATDEERRSQAARAGLAERLGDVRGALQIWDALAAHPETAEGKKAIEEGKRLRAARAATPYLGVSLDSEMMVKAVAPRGPAALAGVKVGDRLVKLGTVVPATTDDLRTALQALQPGDRVPLDVERDGRPLTLSVTVGAQPAKE